MATTHSTAPPESRRVVGCAVAVGGSTTAPAERSSRCPDDHESAGRRFSRRRRRSDRHLRPVLVEAARAAVRIPGDLKAL
ncbi:transposase [Actinoallomurus sp. NPDC052274]|uniref:transposase n=1 Tax=Actinoallomurus sp. NPDC052274 TaxID=3155420 RepID=UPI00341F1E37